MIACSPLIFVTITNIYEQTTESVLETVFYYILLHTISRFASLFLHKKEVYKFKICRDLRKQKNF